MELVEQVNGLLEQGYNVEAASLQLGKGRSGSEEHYQKWDISIIEKQISIY